MRLLPVLLAALGVALAVAVTLYGSPFGPQPGPKFSTKPSRRDYDFVIVGGGTAGCLIAAQLATANSHWSILLLEAGGATRDGALTEQTVPGLAVENVGAGWPLRMFGLAAAPEIDWGYQVEPQQTPLKGISPSVPRGKVLGGSNELNFMLHVRGAPMDYDGWAKATGESRWGRWKMARLEDEYVELLGGVMGSKAAPADGSAAHSHVLADAWVKSSEEAGLTSTTAYNDNLVREGRNGAFHYEHAVGPKDGRRLSTARQVLLPLLQGANNHSLEVVLNAQVSQLLWKPASLVLGEEDNWVKPRGIRGVRATLSTGEVYDVTAKKEVILAAGAYESPHLLLKSGVGSVNVLREFGIDTVSHLKGVGKHLQDHPIVGLKYRLGEPEGEWWPISSSKMSLIREPISILWRYLTQGKGALSSAGCDLGYFGWSNESYIGRPDLQMHGLLTPGDPSFVSDFLRFTSHFMNDVGTPADYSALWAHGLTVAPTLLHPVAEGEVTLNPDNLMVQEAAKYLLRPGNMYNGKEEIYGSGPPKIAFEAFGEEDDLRRLVDGIRRLQRIMASPAMAVHKPTLLHSASLAKDFVEDSDEYWREYAKRFGFVVYHPTGTCKMGTVEDLLAVVDPELRVIGVQGVRVADASVMPDIVSGNTNMPTAAIALQLVDLLKEEYL